MRRSSSQIRLSGLPVPLRVLVGRCRYLRVGYLGRGVLAVNHGARGHTTKIILWGSRSSIVISRRHKGEATTSTTSSTSTLVGAHPCLLIPKAQITSNHYFPKESPFD